MRDASDPGFAALDATITKALSPLLEEFGLLDDEELRYYARAVRDALEAIGWGVDMVHPRVGPGEALYALHTFKNDFSAWVLLQSGPGLPQPPATIPLGVAPDHV